MRPPARPGDPATSSERGLDGRRGGAGRRCARPSPSTRSASRPLAPRTRAAGHRAGSSRSSRAGWSRSRRSSRAIGAILERDHALRAVDRGALPRPELIERTTGGIRWLPEAGVRRVILAPTYFSRPYNFLLAGAGLAVLRLSVADDALEAADRLAPPQARRPAPSRPRRRDAAAHPKLLARQDLYLTEIAQQLELSKPTIKHHLAQLRAAGLVTVIEAGPSSTTASGATASRRLGRAQALPHSADAAGSAIAQRPNAHRPATS